MSGVLLWAGVGVLGALGALLRWQVDLRVGARVDAGTLVWGTFTVNVSGAALLGLLTGLALSRDVELLLATAFVGAYTTFSTWMLDTERLAEEGLRRDAVANVLVSLGLGLAALALGRWVGGRL